MSQPCTTVKPYRLGVFTRQQERFRFRLIPTYIPFSFHTIFKQFSCRHLVNGTLKNWLQVLDIRGHVQFIHCTRDLLLQWKIGHFSKTSLIQETEGENLLREWDFRPLCGAVNYCVFRASRGFQRIGGDAFRNTWLYKMQGFIVVTCFFLDESELNLCIICFRFITNIINYVTGLAETKKCPQNITFTKNRQNKLSHFAKKWRKNG